MTATFGDRRWVFPSGDCRLLPVANTTAELLAAYIGGQLLAVAGERGGKASQRLQVEVDECDGQIGVWEHRRLSIRRRLAIRSLGETRPRAGRKASRNRQFFSSCHASRADMSSGQTARYAAASSRLLIASTRLSHAMSDIHNAAVLLMTLPEEEAGELMSKLDPKQVEQVSIEIARTRTIAADEQERVIKEFTEANPVDGRPRRRAGAGQVADSEGAGHATRRRRSTTSASRSRPRRSASCGTSIARTC